MKRRKASEDSTATESAESKPVVTPSNAKRAIAVGKVLAPVLAPIAMRAAAVARGAWDERKARRLGVAPGELKNFSGKGGALHARIAGVGGSLAELRAGSHGVTAGERAAEVNAFVAGAEPRLVDLSAAVRAAELMPADRRRAAHRAVSAELDQLEPQLLRLLGVSTHTSHNGQTEH
ncbi:MAG TPA: DUF6474 family protein [Pseudonocardia sp.]|jgi:hypothetical protein